MFLSKSFLENLWIVDFPDSINLNILFKDYVIVMGNDR